MGLSKLPKVKILLFFIIAITIGLLYFYLNKLHSIRQQLLLKNQKLSERIVSLEEVRIENEKLKNEIAAYEQTTKKCELCYKDSILIKKSSLGGYFLCIDGKPILVKGVGYSPIPIGKGHNYNFFTDPNKPWLIDGKLMKEAGINCVRIYNTGDDLIKVKEFIRDMYEKFGIYTIVGDWLGLWGQPAANYADMTFQNNITQKILTMVESLKGEKGLLMWVLGNENNYTFTGEIGFWTSPEIENIEDQQKKQTRRAEIYYSFINDVAAKIKKIDKNHPIALGNGEANFLNIASSICENIDLLAIIIYRGKTFGNFFENIKNSFNLPILVSEFGCDSYDAYNNKESQEVQAEFVLEQWKDLYKNTVFSNNKSGNVIGGCLFEWNDEWWKHNEGYEPNWSMHNTDAGWSHSGYYFDIKAKDNLNMNEEWFGIVSLEEGLEESNVPKRTPKKAYYMLQEYLLSLDSNNPA